MATRWLMVAKSFNPIISIPLSFLIPSMNAEESAFSCASIFWKSAASAGEAAEALNLTAKRLHSLKLIQEVIEEPLGGAHRNMDEMAATLKTRLIANLAGLQKLSTEELIRARQEFWLNT